MQMPDTTKYPFRCLFFAVHIYLAFVHLFFPLEGVQFFRDEAQGRKARKTKEAINQIIPDDSRPMNYSETVMFLEKSGKLEYPQPYIPAPLVKLQFLADAIADRVDWVGDVYLQLTDVDHSADKSVQEFMQDSFRPGRLPQAMITMECGIDPDTGDDKIYMQSMIHFSDRRFLSVGHLLHELAHLHPPFNDHGEEFQAALQQLQDLWETIFKHYGIIELQE